MSCNEVLLEEEINERVPKYDGGRIVSHERLSRRLYSIIFVVSLGEMVIKVIVCGKDNWYSAIVSTSSSLSRVLVYIQ
jgi:hypothetical protein